MTRTNLTLYVLGSSVAWGFPYAPRCDIATIVSQTWRGSANGRSLVTYNEARYGRPSGYVVERARAFMQTTKHEPGAAVAFIYSGNNEFLHLPLDAERSGRGPALMADGEHDLIVENHRRNLDTSITELHRAGVEVVLSTIPVNLLDWPPTYTVLDAPYATEIEQAYTDALRLRRSGDAEGAEKLLLPHLATESAPAQLHFLLGRIQRKNGQSNDAGASFTSANDADGRPIRATTAINRNIRSLTEARSVRLVDAEAEFAAAAPDTLCGSSQFWDDCHPYLDGYVRLAGLLSEHIADIVGAGGAPVRPSVDSVRRNHNIDDSFLADVYGRMGLYCYKHAGCWDNERPLDLAKLYLRTAADMVENVEVDIALALVLAHLGRESDARQNIQRALRADRGRALWLLHGPEARSVLEGWGVTSIERWANAGPPGRGTC